MNAEVIDIGQYLKIPFDMIVSKISNRAFRVWTLIAAGASEEDPVIALRQSTLAEQLGCSKFTIGRAIAELKTQGLMSEAGKWNKGRSKIYQLNWRPGMSTVEEEPKESVESATELDDLLIAHGETWSQAYACFDGVSGRPSLRECVDEALHNASRAKGASLKTFIDGWLHIASQRWRVSDAPRQKNPPTPLSAPCGYDKGGEDNSSMGDSDEAEAWIIAQIKADNDKQRIKESLEAKRQASFLSRGAAANKPFEPRVEKPICRDNYPLSWEFYRIQWADSRRNVAA